MSDKFLETGNVSDIADYRFLREMVTPSAWYPVYAQYVRALLDLDIGDALLYPELMSGVYGRIAYLVEVDHSGGRRRAEVHSRWGFNVTMRPITPCGAYYRPVNKANGRYHSLGHHWKKISTMDEAVEYETTVDPRANKLILFTNSVTSRNSVNIFSSWTLPFASKESATKYGAWVINKMAPLMMDETELIRVKRKPHAYTGEWNDYY